MLKEKVKIIGLFWCFVWIAIGAILGALAYKHISYAIYFLFPFIIFGLIGLIPSIFFFILIQIEKLSLRIIWSISYLVFFIFLFSIPTFYRGYYETPKNGGPYLVISGDPKTTMTVCWTSEVQIPGEVEYVKEGASEWKKVSCSPTYYPKIRLENLEPGTAYHYRIPALGKEEYSFHTAPATPTDFSFVVYGDNRPFSGISFHSSVLNAITKEEPSHGKFDLIFNTGDIVENPGPGYGWQWYHFLKEITPLASARPYLVSLGNHEARGTTIPYEKYFDYGTSTHWYFFDYAGVRFIILSSEDNINKDSPQYNWLLQTLDSRPPKTKFTAVFLHKPIITYDPRESYRNTNLREILEPVFQEKKVDIVFAGHVHAYEHHFISGFHHVITGGGGVLLWAKPVPGPETIKTETCWHFCAVDIRNGEMNVRAIRNDGTLLDTFNITSQEH